MLVSAGAQLEYKTGPGGYVPMRRLGRRLLSGHWDYLATAAFGSGRACDLPCRLYLQPKGPWRDYTKYMGLLCQTIKAQVAVCLAVLQHRVISPAGWLERQGSLIMTLKTVQQTFEQPYNNS